MGASSGRLCYYYYDDDDDDDGDGDGDGEDDDVQGTLGRGLEDRECIASQEILKMAERKLKWACRKAQEGPRQRPRRPKKR